MAWVLFLLGTYSLVSAYASIARDADGNNVGGGLAVPALAFLGCSAAAGGCLLAALRLRR